MQILVSKCGAVPQSSRGTVEYINNIRGFMINIFNLLLKKKSEISFRVYIELSFKYHSLVFGIKHQLLVSMHCCSYNARYE